jgi:hypothetical protein
MRPDLLYKYTTAETGLTILESGKLRWSSPRIFNDPSEFQRIPRFDPPLDEALRLLPKIIVASASGEAPLEEGKMVGLTRQMHKLVKACLNQGMTPEQFHEEVDHPFLDPDSTYAEMMRQFFGDNFINQARVMCLTANPTNSAMWANYSGLHTGCLLGFRHLFEKDTPFQEAKEVQYHAKPPVVGSGIEFLLYGGTPEILGASMDGMCFAKKSDWANEQEWRVITWRSQEGESLYGDYPFFPEELESVTFGLQTTPATKSAIYNIVSSHYSECNLFEISHDNGELCRIKI